MIIHSFISLYLYLSALCITPKHNWGKKMIDLNEGNFKGTQLNHVLLFNLFCTVVSSQQRVESIDVSKNILLALYKVSFQ